MQQSTAPDAPSRARTSVGSWIAIVLGFLVNGAFILAIVVVAVNQQRIADQFVVWRYEPTAAIAEHVERSTMTDEGKFLYYASEPRVVGESQFDPICASHQEGNGVLGCYLLASRTIVIYDVTDARLDGIEEVVAAHEMLHAAWDRLSPAEQARLTPLLQAEVAKRADDESLADTLAFYAKAEPGERANELHSILGTQYGNLSPALEAHYATYFGDRQKLVNVNASSMAVFDEQNAQGEALIAQMDALNASAEADYAVYNSGYDQLNADIDDFNRRADAGSFSSESQFDAERAVLMQRGADLDLLYASIEARLKQYDELSAKIDDLNAVIDDLSAHLNIDPPRSSK